MSDSSALDPRELVRTVLPEARRRYARSWEYLAAPDRTLADRKSGRATVVILADEHTELVQLVEGSLAGLQGEDLQTAKVLIEQLTPIIDGWRRLATLSAHGIRTADSIKPEALGCGKRYRPPQATPGASRAVRLRPPAPGRGVNRRDNRSRGEHHGRDGDG